MSKLLASHNALLFLKDPHRFRISADQVLLPKISFQNRRKFDVHARARICMRYLTLLSFKEKIIKAVSRRVFLGDSFPKQHGYV